MKRLFSKLVRAILTYWKTKMKKTFIVTVETADDLPTQYPNYRWNYDTPDEFIRARMEEFVHLGEHGYTITYRERL